MSMEMTSSIIIDLRFFLRWRDLHHGDNGSVGSLKFSRYGSLDLASSDRSWIFSHSRREEYYPHNNFSDCYIIDNGDSYSWLPTMSTKLFSYFALTCLCCYSCRYWLTTLVAARVHVALILWLKLKLWENLCWYLQVYGSVLFDCLLKI
jgi:hypothetical protein